MSFWDRILESAEPYIDRRLEVVATERGDDKELSDFRSYVTNLGYEADMNIVNVRRGKEGQFIADAAGKAGEMEIIYTPGGSQMNVSEFFGGDVETPETSLRVDAEINLSGAEIVETIIDHLSSEYDIQYEEVTYDIL